MPHKTGKWSDLIQRLQVGEAIFKSMIDWSYNDLKTPKQNFSMQKLLQQIMKYHCMFSV